MLERAKIPPKENGRKMPIKTNERASDGAARGSQPCSQRNADGDLDPRNTAGTWATCTIAAQAPATTWYLAEGCTVGMDTYILVQNPGNSAVTVDVKFQTATGQAQGPVDTIPAHARHSYRANDYVTSTNVSSKVTASGGVVVERSMYGPGWIWATGSIGYPL